MNLPTVIGPPETTDTEDVGGQGHEADHEADHRSNARGKPDPRGDEGEDQIGQHAADAADHDRTAEALFCTGRLRLLVGIGERHPSHGSVTSCLLGGPAATVSPVNRSDNASHPVPGAAASDPDGSPIDLLALTADLVDHPSVSFEETAFVDWLEQWFTALGHLQVTRVGDNLVARTNLGRPQRLILAGHSDTVPVNGNGVARVENDVLWGVGSADMKGGLAVMLELARSVSEPAVDVSYVIYAREEVAREHSGLTELVRLRPDLVAGDCAILGEPTSGDVEAGCQGAMRLELTLAGARAHTARPWMGRNAVHRLAPILTLLDQYQERSPLLDNCQYRESLQAVGVTAGIAGNVVPDAAQLRIHFRYAPDRSAVEAEAHIRDLLAPHLDAGDELAVVDSAPACAPSLTHPLLQRLVADNKLGVRAKLGWTDVAQFAELGIPATNFGPGDPTVAHSADERLDRADLQRCHGALAGLITRP